MQTKKVGLSSEDAVCISGAVCSILCLFQCCHESRSSENDSENFSAIGNEENKTIHYYTDFEKPIEIMIDEEYLIRGDVNLEDPDIYIRLPIRLLFIPKRLIGYVKGFRFTYFKIHVIYFLVLCLFGALILWLIETCINAQGRLQFIDALFIATSAVCVTGLSTVDFSKFCFGSQFFVMMLIFLGGNVLMSLVPVAVRRNYFRRHIKKQTKTSSSSQIEKILKKGDVGLEYEGLGKILMIVSLYIFLSIVIGFLIAISYFYFDNVTVVGEDAPRWFSSLFHTISSFNNAGFSLYSLSLIPLQKNWFILIIWGIAILFGNQAFPIMVRFIVVSIYRTKQFIGHKDHDFEVYKYMLKNPRKVYTHLFPATQTNVLILLLFTFIGVEILLFFILDWNTPGIWNDNPSGFQNASTRTAGFSVLDISAVNQAMWVLWVALMYISSYPVIVAIRRSTVNTKHEHFKETESFRESLHFKKKRTTKIFQNLLLRDIGWMFLAFFFIAIAETNKLRTAASAFSLFKILFEIVSAYGTVGFSIGYPGTVVSFSAQFTAFSKVILCIVMFLGRHRGLPYTIDRAVQISHNARHTRRY